MHPPLPAKLVIRCSPLKMSNEASKGDAPVRQLLQGRNPGITCKIVTDSIRKTPLMIADVVEFISSLEADIWKDFFQGW